MHFLVFVLVILERVRLFTFVPVYKFYINPFLLNPNIPKRSAAKAKQRNVGESGQKFLNCDCGQCAVSPTPSRSLRCNHSLWSNRHNSRNYYLIQIKITLIFAKANFGK